MAKKPNTAVPTKKHLARVERENIQRRYILIGTAVVAILVIGLLAYGLLDNYVFRAYQPVAAVGDTKITTQDFQSRVRFQRYQLIQQFNQYYSFLQQFQGDPFNLTPTLQQISTTLDQPIVLGKEVLDQMIADILLEKEAVKRGISITDAEIKAAYEAYFGYYPSGTPTPSITPSGVVTRTFSPTQLAIITLTPSPTSGPTVTPSLTPSPTSTPTPGAGTPTAIPPTVTPTPSPTSIYTATPEPSLTASSTPTPYTEAGFKALSKNYFDQLVSIKFTEAELMKLMRYQVVRQKMNEIISKEAATSEEQVWARHILLADEASAQAVITRLKNGEDFAKVAQEVSTDTGSAASGGDLGWFGKGAMVAEFEQAAWALKPGEISQPVKSQFGYHIIQVIDHAVNTLDATALENARTQKFSDWVTAALADPSVIRYDTWTSRVPTDPAFTAPVLPDTSSTLPDLGTLPESTAAPTPAP